MGCEMGIKTDTSPCHRCGKLPTTFTHAGASYLISDRECPTCRRFVERCDRPDRAIARWNHTVTRKRHAENGYGIHMVTSEEFQEAWQSAIRLDRGPCGCDSGGTIMIHMPVYGMIGLYIECPQCKASTAVYSISEAFVDKETGRVTTPYTLTAIMESLQMAVEEWNQSGASRKGEQND